MNYFIENVLKRNFKRIPYFFEQKQAYHFEQCNYALIGKLSTSLLHDILTPLTSLSLTADVDDSKNMKLLKPIIKNSSTQIREYVEIMKDFMTEKKSDAPLHINPEIMKCISLLKHKALECGIQVQFIEFDQIHTSIHPLHIYQIVINLLSNAIEASSGSDVRKIILILKKDRDDFFIECKDFGTGRTPETVSQIGVCNFSTKSVTRGYGLYSVKHIVTRILNGKINIQSEPSSGSLFSCRLPIKK